MSRRTFRVKYTVQTRVRVRRQVRYQGTTQLTPMPARRIPQQLTISRATSPLVGIRRAAAEYVEEAEGLSDDDREFDVFISHASEDQAAVVRPLVALLEQQYDLGVWYAESALTAGKSLRRSIDAGLRNSRFGVVVLSRSFFAKEWPQLELDGLVTRSIVEGRQLILPIWHNMSTAEVAAYSPTLADKVALRTTKIDLPEIARQIAEAVRE
jgi:hypothetical protein